MNNENHNTNSTGHGSFERRDIGVGGVLYFLLGLIVFGLISHFMVTALYHYLDKQSETQQAPVNPLVTNAPTDTRHIPEKYEEKAFPDPLLEKDEFTRFNERRVAEDQTLSTYAYIDENAGTVRIPIDRAMELIAQRGLPVRAQGAAPEAAAAKGTDKKKGPKQ